MAKEYKFHPAADCYPLLPPADAAALAADIKENGLQVEIVLLDELILDGRNRYRGCLESGVEPRFIEYSGDASTDGIVAYVRSMNERRRQMSSSQNAAVARLLSEWLKGKLTDEAQERQRASGGDKKSAEAKESVPQIVGEPIDKHAGEAATQLAKLHDTNRQYVSDVWTFDLDTVEKIRDGELTVPQAKSLYKETQQTETRRTLNKQFARPTADLIKNLRNSPGILVSPGWWRPKDTDLMQDYMGWQLGTRLDPGGGILVIRTIGDTRAALDALSLVESWGLDLLPYQVIVSTAGKATNCAAELLVIGTKGKPDLSRLPTRERNQVACPEPGIESLVLSWLRPWAKKRGTPNLIAEILGDGVHDGFQPYQWKPEPAAC